MLSSSLFRYGTTSELADRLVGIYKTENHTKTVAINPEHLRWVQRSKPMTLRRRQSWARMRPPRNKNEKKK